MPDPKPNRFPAIYLVTGFLLTTAGAAWIYKPLGMMLAGALLLAMAFAGKRKA